jgi:hypothetical protein
VTGVIVEQPERDLVERSARGSDLGQHVDAVAVVLDHRLDAPDLTLDPSQPCDQLVLGGGLSASCSHVPDDTPRG